MNIPKDIARLIGSYSKPILWEMSFNIFLSDPNNIHKYLFYANDIQDICKYIQSSKEIKDLLYSLIYTLYMKNTFYFFESKHFNKFWNEKGYLKLINIRDYINVNTEEIVTALNQIEDSGFKIKVVDNIINLY